MHCMELSFSRRSGGVELQVHIPHELPYGLEVPSVLATALAVASSQRQILACHTYRHHQGVVATMRISCCNSELTGIW